MQTRISVAYREVGRDLGTHDRTEHYDCRLAAMRRICNLLDAGVNCTITHAQCDRADKHPVRHVSLWDDGQLHSI